MVEKDGVVVVPIEPTKEMLDAYIDLWSLGFCNEDMARNAWHTFLQASPQWVKTA